MKGLPEGHECGKQRNSALGIGTIMTRLVQNFPLPPRLFFLEEPSPLVRLLWPPPPLFFFRLGIAVLPSSINRCDNVPQQSEHIAKPFPIHREASNCRSYPK
jgi:hypothetical protein